MSVLIWWIGLKNDNDEGRRSVELPAELSVSPRECLIQLLRLHLLGGRSFLRNSIE